MKGGTAGMIEMISLSRKQLYDDIWKHSVRGAAEKYNLHYAKLISSLKEANIPYPPSGYWTRLACGKDVSKEIISLPKSEIDMIELYPANFSISRKTSQSLGRENEKRINEETNESYKENTVERMIPDTVLSFLEPSEKSKVIEKVRDIEVKERSKLHPIIVRYKQSIEEWKQRKKQQSSLQGGGYYRNRYHREPEIPAFVEEVSTAQLNRVIRILDTLFKIIEALGGQAQSNLAMQIRQDLVSIKFAESQNKVNHELTKEEARRLLEYKDAQKQGKYASKPNIRKYDYIYNGKLRVVFNNGKYIRDNEQQKIEDKLDEIIIQLYENSEEHRIEREKREEAHRKYLEKQRLEEEQKARFEKEQKDTMALVNQAKDYQVACEIRNYISAVCKTKDISEEKEKWIQWASKKADWFDPMIALCDEHLGIRNHALSEEEKEIVPNKRNFYRGW